uniref:Uncharacterized protein n=1 Tax=Kalanchoe fedtschenkoi TaxID=63787 RepID=A0A7N0UNL7_KALFE
MAANVGAAGEPIPTSAVLMASSKHIGTRCLAENVAFLKCKKKDPNPEKCLEKGQQVTRCVFGLKRRLRLVEVAGKDQAVSVLCYSK